MQKVLLIITLALALQALPQTAGAQDVRRAPVEQEIKEVKITVSESTVYIKNADTGTRMQVYNMAGVCVAEYRVDSPDRSFDLAHLPKGCYIIKVGKVARKVFLK